MAKKTNCVINGNSYYKLNRKIGKKLSNLGIWVDDYKTFYGKSKKDAEQKYIDYMEKRTAGITSEKCAGEAIEDWINGIFKSCELAIGTKRKYIRAYEKIFQHSKIAGRQLTDLTPMDLQALYNETSSPPATIRAMHNLMRRFFKYAELNSICRDITGSLTVPKSNKNEQDDFSDIDVWIDEDLKKLISSLEGNTLRLLVIMAVNTGARFSELLALTYNDIRGNMLYINKQLSDAATLDEETHYRLHVEAPKTSESNRIIPLSKAVLKEIEKHKELQESQMDSYGYKTDLLFSTSHGTYYYKRNVSRSLERHYKKIGVPYHKFHAFRHTFGTNLSRAGVPIEETSKLMGHSDISMTLKYYVNINAERRLGAVEKIVGYSL